MNRSVITSIDDPRVAPYRQLPSSRLARRMGLFVCEGRWLVERLLASDYEVDSILLEERELATVHDDQCPAVPIYVTATGLIEKIVGFNFHRGILACGRRRKKVALSHFMAEQMDRRLLTLVFCVGVQDPENLGGILRNSAAFGVDAVVFNSQCADPFSRRVLRVSMGAVLKLPLLETKDLGADLEQLRLRWGVEFAATVLSDRALPLETVRRPERLGLLFGNEAHGLGADWSRLCDHQITIPMQLSVDSLNVAVASGIFLYHFTRCAPLISED